MGRFGKTNLMISELIIELLKGDKVAVADCKNPEEITNRLKEKGIEVTSEPMIATIQMKAIYDDDGIVGFENGDSHQTGFLFYLSVHSELNKITFENGSELNFKNDNPENQGRGVTPLSKWDAYNNI